MFVDNWLAAGLALDFGRQHCGLWESGGFVYLCFAAVSVPEGKTVVGAIWFITARDCVSNYYMVLLGLSHVQQFLLSQNLGSFQDLMTSLTMEDYAYEDRDEKLDKQEILENTYRESKGFKLYVPPLQIEKLLYLADCDVNRTTNLNAACRLIKLGDDFFLLRKVRMKYKLDDDDDDKRWLRRADERFLHRKRNIESRFQLTSQESLELRRILYCMFGDLYYDCGNLSETFRSFHQELSSCTMGKQVIQSHFNLILVSLKRGNLENVLVWVENVRQRDFMESIVAAKVTCACALAHMGLGRYKTAACEFFDVDYGLLGDTFNELMGFSLVD